MKISPYYVSPTLLNAFTNGYDSLVSMIKREPVEETQAMRDGIEFEQRIVNGEIGELNSIINGALYQTPLYKAINDYIGIFGYSDFIKYDTIYDAKYVSSYDIGKYSKSTQHLCYTYCTDIDKFTYIVGCGDSIFYEPYTRNDKKLFEIVNQFVAWLDKTELKSIFEQNYKIDSKLEIIKGAQL